MIRVTVDGDFGHIQWPSHGNNMKLFKLGYAARGQAISSGKKKHLRRFMKSRRLKIAAAALSLLALAIPAFAHHGAAAYDTTKTITVRATIADFQFINPHVLLFFEVRGENGTVEKWQGELTSPNHLARTGWTKSSLKPADEVTLTGARAKNGSNALWISKVVLANGEELKLSAGDN